MIFTADTDTGIRPQLLNAISEAQVVELLADDAFWMQEKKDGKRCLIEKYATVVGVNRNGHEIDLPSMVSLSAMMIPDGYVIDGELIGDQFYAFDLLELDCVDRRELPYRERYALLCSIIGAGVGSIEVVPTWIGTDDKREAMRAFRECNAEGVVFKRCEAPYVPNRPSSGGDQLKFKFVATASVIVSRVNAQRSVQMQVLDGKSKIKVGNVTIPANAEAPEVGTIIEVRYLYAYHGGALVQPVYIGVRDDISPANCELTQLKYKR